MTHNYATGVGYRFIMVAWVREEEKAVNTPSPEGRAESLGEML